MLPGAHALGYVTWYYGYWGGGGGGGGGVGVGP